MTVTSFWDELPSKFRCLNSWSKYSPQSKCCVVCFVSAGHAILGYETTLKNVKVVYGVQGSIIICFQIVCLNSLKINAYPAFCLPRWNSVQTIVMS